MRIIGLPRFGEVRIDGKTVAVNTVVSAEQFKTAVFKPDGKSIGPAGTLDILVEDGRGGSVTGEPADHRAVFAPSAGAGRTKPCAGRSAGAGHTAAGQSGWRSVDDDDQCAAPRHRAQRCRDSASRRSRYAGGTVEADVLAGGRIYRTGRQPAIHRGQWARRNG